jgi:hypothetical protein
MKPRNTHSTYRWNNVTMQWRIVISVSIIIID